ncbi:FAD:protein FMN transferase [Haloferula sp.]|uniref:FAD:protein FMN transferase n=1 Tax=Haloferula sp. TaxID=2497595 RepID=UPI003C72BA6E
MFACVGCREAGKTVVFTGEAMGTSYRIKCAGGKGFDTGAIDVLCDQLDEELSTWRDDSWVSRFNAAPAATRFVMPEHVEELLKLSKAITEETHGRFDPTAGALVKLWGFGAWKNEWTGEPSDGEVSAALEASGFGNLQIDGHQIMKSSSQLMLDFSGIAKGYAVDQMAGLLREDGYRDFVIEFGGEVFASGAAPGKDHWTISGPAQGSRLQLRNEAAASSGSEHQHRGMWSHVIDPRNGRPIRVGPPVTVRARTCARADALATATLVKAAEPSKRPRTEER